MMAWAMVGRSAPLQRVVDDNVRVVLSGNLPPLARPEFDVGRADGSLPEERVILALAMQPEKRAALERLLVEQHDPASPNFHHWLTPREFGTRFGATPDEISLVTTWLQSHGFIVDEVANSNLWVNVTGTVADVEAAFRTQIHGYLVEGEIHHANATDPSIPRALADLVAGVVSLNDFRSEPASHLVRATTEMEGGSHWLSPADFATIYDLNPLYAAGITGAGQSIAVVARSNIKLSDVQYFRSTFNLPSNDPQFIINGPDPGIVCPTDPTKFCDEGEADLDVEWAGAVAPNATIKMVISQSTTATDGVYLSAQYIVDNNVAPVLTMSYLLCESALGSGGNAWLNTLWSQAVAQGISVFVCSGDSGAAGCDADTSTTATGGLAVNGICTTPYSVCVGGTEFMDTSNPTQYWSTHNNSTTLASALSFIPEQVWNESGAAVNCPADVTCQQLWATGGGKSTVYAKPAWQVAPGVPNDGARDVPDVALAAATHNAYMIIQEHAPGSTGFNGWGGTSAAAPSFAGIMALVVQKTGQRQGNPNLELYRLGNAQYNGTGPTVFHDVTVGSNSVPGQTGFSCGTGYDLATGLGSVDATAVVNNWGSSSGLFSDSFEGGFPGNWHLLLSQNADTSVAWGRSTYRSASGVASLWCAGGGTNAQPPGGSYLPNEGTWAVYGPFSLAGATAAQVQFDTWYNTEPYNATTGKGDRLSWMISTDGSNFSGFYNSGNSGGWVHKTMDFSDVTNITAVGASQVWFAFLFSSDSSVQAEGAYVDNVVLTKTVASPICTYALSPASQSFAAPGGSATMSVTAGSGCGWTAASQTPWITITAGSSGSGNGSVSYSVQANTGSARSGTLTVAGQTFTVYQAALTCSYSLAPQSANFLATGGTGSFVVTSPGGCQWSAAWLAAWINVTSGANGSGIGTVSYSVQANTGSARTGTITVGGQTFTVNQGAQSCTYSLSPTSGNYPAAGGGGYFSVNTATGCPWTASTAATWIHVTTPSGSGGMTVNFTLDANAGSSRTGTISVAGLTFTVNQSGVAPTSYAYWIPVASHASGFNQSQWRSDLGLLNTGSVTANVQLKFFGSNSVSTTTYVAPHAQSILIDIVGQMNASGSGPIEVLSDQPLKVTARTYNQVALDAICYANGTQGQNYPVVAASDGLGAGQSAYLAGLTENASYRCNIGVVNTGTQSATLLVELFDGAGAKLGDYPVTLAAGQWSQPTQPFLNVAHQTAMDRGYAKITVQSGSGVFAFASVVDNITNDPTPVTMQR
jgi:hypothetical protein